MPYSPLLKSIESIEIPQSMYQLLLLAMLWESSNRFLSAADLRYRLSDYNIEYSDRHISRVLRDLEQAGLVYEFKGHRRRLSRDADVNSAVFAVLRNLQLRSSFAGILFGGIDASLQRKKLENICLCETMLFLLLAICARRTVSFEYDPQTAATIKKMEEQAKQGKSGGCISAPAILMQPVFIAFRGDKVILNGEIWKHGIAEHRSYELQGISHVQIGEVRTPQLSLDPEKIYENSLKSWVSGPNLKVTVLDEVRAKKNLPGKYEITVNGPDEILDEVVISQGLKKILNPDDLLLQRARERGFDEGRLFIQENN